ncbi:hypothetical protein IE53DRAFT_42156 [Violaceomyces palustris]|uniref:Uncharacterized protein n=1 Tax=Violaceomyces palustris TaxID=1673888 RepID=A0ACD0P0V9_9BASI|nr:hypothetical protein IE53DRAFT_42156 [Violaceomyces palustris]
MFPFHLRHRVFPLLPSLPTVSTLLLTSLRASHPLARNATLSPLVLSGASQSDPSRTWVYTSSWLVLNLAFTLSISETIVSRPSPQLLSHRAQYMPCWE